MPAHENIYDKIAASNDYQQNYNWLRLIQIAVFTVSAFATGFINSYAHKDRIGDAGAFFLAIAIVAFVEAFYFALRQGLTTTYKAGKQRIAAQVCYRAIQITMILNAALLCSMITGFEPPSLESTKKSGVR